MVSSRWLWLGSAGFWTVVGALFVVQELVVYRMIGRPQPIGRVLAEHVVEWGTWAVLTPLLLAFVRARPPSARPVRRTATLYAGAGVAATLSSVAIIALGRYLFPWHDPAVDFWRTYVANLARLFAYSLVLFLLVTALAAAFTYYRDARERELAAARLEARLASARTDVLTMQLQPHFLFNTLNTIAGLTRTDARKAEHMITGLGELLRTSLRPDRPSMVTLREEVTFLRRYLDIQQTRFDERLTTVVDVPDDLQDVLVPSFVLQPLVENAIQHAVAAYSSPVTVIVSARRAGSEVHLAVRDDGPGLSPAPSTARHGIGIANTRARLRELYGSDRMDVRDRPEGGVEALVTLPLRTTASGPV